MVLHDDSIISTCHKQNKKLYTIVSTPSLSSYFGKQLLALPIANLPVFSFSQLVQPPLTCHVWANNYLA
jgi:hypothetical protein